MARHSSISGILETVRRIRPYAFSDFYRRGRPVRRSPAPSPPQITFLLLQRCSLGCRFCFAGSALKRGGDVAFSRLKPLFDACRDVHRAVMLGGEPFEHPEIIEILGYAMEVISEEVEVYTNTAHLPETLDELDAWLERLGDGHRRARLVLTMAIDRYHIERLGEARSRERVRQWLELREKRGRKVRFNLTDEAFQGETYLSRFAVRDVLAGFSPELAEFFFALNEAQDIENLFYFNPVQRQGRRRADHGASVPLRLSELARGGDLVIGPDLGDEGDSPPLALFDSLNAAWASPPPAFSRVALLEGERAQDLADAVRKALCARTFFASSGPANVKAETSDPCTQLSDFKEECLFAMRLVAHSPDDLWSTIAGRLFEAAQDVGELEPEAASWTETLPLPLPVLHDLTRRFMEQSPETLPDWITDFVRERLHETGEGDAPQAPVLETEWLDLEAMIPSETPLRLPMSSIGVDTGLGPYPGESSHPVRIEATVLPTVRIHWDFPGFQPSRVGESRPGDARLWLRFWRLVVGETFWRAAVLAWREALQARYSDKGALEVWLDEMASEEAPAEALFVQAARDPGRMFRLLAFEPRRGGINWMNVELLQALLDDPGEGWDARKLASFRQGLQAALERARRRKAP